MKPSINSNVRAKPGRLSQTRHESSWTIRHRKSIIFVLGFGEDGQIGT
jgi:hypothetical protein